MPDPVDPFSNRDRPSLSAQREGRFSLTHVTRPATVGAAPHPGLLLLHGLGDSEQRLISLAAAFDPRVYVVSARAPLPYRWGGYAWFDLEGEGVSLGTPSIRTSGAKLERFLDEIVAAYPIDTGRVYTAGFSMGAAMAGAMALLLPQRIRGAVMVSGFLPIDDAGRYRITEVAGHPFFQAHGTLDTVVPLQAAHLTRDFLTGASVDLTYREYPTGHSITPEELAELTDWFAEKLV